VITFNNDAKTRVDYGGDVQNAASLVGATSFIAFLQSKPIR
jgi:hypothetical protein